MRVVLSIAGSDPIAGAGIQADLKTFAALGVYGTSVITAVTSQNTAGVTDTFGVPSDTVQSQLEAIFDDVAVAAVKTGMLASGSVISAVADAFSRRVPPNIVVDPVMLATSGTRRTLLSPDGVLILTSRLFPIATVVTPNLAEAAALSGIAVDTLP